MFNIGFFSGKIYIRSWVHLRNVCLFFLTWATLNKRVFFLGVSLTLIDDNVKMLCLDRP